MTMFADPELPRIFEFDTDHFRRLKMTERYFVSRDQWPLDAASLLIYNDCPPVHKVITPGYAGTDQTVLEVYNAEGDTNPVIFISHPPNEDQNPMWRNISIYHAGNGGSIYQVVDQRLCLCNSEKSMYVYVGNAMDEDKQMIVVIDVNEEISEAEGTEVEGTEREGKEMVSMREIDLPEKYPGLHFDSAVVEPIGRDKIGFAFLLKDNEGNLYLSKISPI